MLIFPMQPSHLNRVLQIELDTGLAAWSAADYERILDDPYRWTARVALAGSPGSAGYVVGFAVAMIAPPDMELSKIGLEPAWQGKGIAKLLLKEVLRYAVVCRCTSCFLEVRPSNHRAIAFYQAHGFEVYGQRPDYYQNPKEDALLMKLALSQESCRSSSTSRWGKMSS